MTFRSAATQKIGTQSRTQQSRGVATPLHPHTHNADHNANNTQIVPTANRKNGNAKNNNNNNSNNNRNNNNKLKNPMLT